MIGSVIGYVESFNLCRSCTNIKSILKEVGVKNCDVINIKDINYNTIIGTRSMQSYSTESEAQEAIFKWIDDMFEKYKNAVYVEIIKK
jgi:hypothetical protein